MNEQKIRERLEEYKKAKAIGFRSLRPFADWMAEELERQLEHNTAMRELLERWVKALEECDVVRADLKEIFDDTKTLLKELKER